jgi:hypothetical protein
VKAAGPFTITPERPACLVAGAFPVLGAVIEPADTVESARLHFRPEGYRLWYSVPMRRTAERFVAVLPKPRPSAQRIVYFVEATAFKQRARSLELTVPVAEPGECGGEPAPVVESAAITVSVPKGAPALPPVPPGFVPTGAVAAEGGGSGFGGVALVLGAAGAASGAALASQGTGDPDREPFRQTFTPELALLESSPPPGSTISIGAGVPLSFRVRVRLHQSIQVGQVRVSLYRAAEGFVRTCGVVSVPHNGFVLNAPTEVVVSGPLQQARPCEADRLRIVVEDFGREFLATGTPGLPELVLRYSLVP